MAQDKDTRYYVNDEERHTTEHKLTMAQVVEGAGFTPASDYELEEDDHGNRTYADPAEEVTIHEDQHFTVTYKGVTPTSQ